MASQTAEAVAEAEVLGAVGTVTVTSLGPDGGLQVTSIDAAAAPEVVAATADVVAVEADRTAALADAPPAVPDGPTPAAPGASPSLYFGWKVDPFYDSGNQWGLTQGRYTDAWACGRGDGIDVAVIDTGVDRSHPDFTVDHGLGSRPGRVLGGAAFLDQSTVDPDGTGPLTAPGPALGKGSLDRAAERWTGSGGDPLQHGTHVAGTVAAGDRNGGIAGAAPDVRILPVRIFNDSIVGWGSDIAAGVVWAVDNGAEIVSMSLVMGPSATLDAALAYAESRNVVVVAAAGNYQQTMPGWRAWPAAAATVVAVGAVDSAGAVAGFSQQGDYVDVTAPGVSVLSTVPGGAWLNASGTSMATPHVASVVALMLSARGTMTPVEVRTRLTTTATDRGTPGFDNSYGWGTVDPLAAVGATVASTAP